MPCLDPALYKATQNQQDRQEGGVGGSRGLASRACRGLEKLCIRNNLRRFRNLLGPSAMKYPGPALALSGPEYQLCSPINTYQLSGTADERVVSSFTIYGMCKDHASIPPNELKCKSSMKSKTDKNVSHIGCLIHELYLTNHHSSQEHATYGTSCLLLAFLSPTTCHLSNLINLI